MSNKKDIEPLRWERQVVPKRRFQTTRHSMITRKTKEFNTRAFHISSTISVTQSGTVSHSCTVHSSDTITKFRYTHRIGCVDVHSGVQILNDLLLLTSPRRTQKRCVWVGLQWERSLFATKCFTQGYYKEHTYCQVRLRGK